MEERTRLLATSATDRGNTMKAIVQDRYGSPDVLELREIDTPALKDDEVLVRVHAAALHAGDYFAMRGRPYVARLFIGLPKPKKDYVVGAMWRGSVEAVGKNVTRFQPGDEVFGECSGACAEYAVCRRRQARAEAGQPHVRASRGRTRRRRSTALQGLRDAGKVQPGQKVLINGASGGVGTFAVQIAKALGAEVTGVCSTRNVDMVRSIGADHVIDYTQEDFTQGGQRYDLILDNVANRSLSDVQARAHPRGDPLAQQRPCRHGLHHQGVRDVAVRAPAGTPVRLDAEDSEDLVALKELIEAGKVTPVIDRTYPLRETPEAFRYLGEGHARGKVVITV